MNLGIRFLSRYTIVAGIFTRRGNIFIIIFHPITIVLLCSYAQIKKMGGKVFTEGYSWSTWGDLRYGFFTHGLLIHGGGVTYFLEKATTSNEIQGLCNLNRRHGRLQLRCWLYLSHHS